VETAATLRPCKCVFFNFHSLGVAAVICWMQFVYNVRVEWAQVNYVRGFNQLPQVRG